MKKLSTGVGMLVLSIALAIFLYAIGKSMQEMTSWNHQVLLNAEMAL